jgi:hypothetical protein
MFEEGLAKEKDLLVNIATIDKDFKSRNFSLENTKGLVIGKQRLKMISMKKYKEALQPKGLAQLVVTSVVGHLAPSMPTSARFEKP